MLRLLLIPIRVRNWGKIAPSLISGAETSKDGASDFVSSAFPCAITAGTSETHFDGAVRSVLVYYLNLTRYLGSSAVAQGASSLRFGSSEEGEAELVAIASPPYYIQLSQGFFLDQIGHRNSLRKEVQGRRTVFVDE